MDIDWAVSIIAFLLFTTWAISLYTATYTPKQPTDIAETALGVADLVTAALYADVRVVSFNVTRANSSFTVGRNETFYFNYSWPYGKNTTRIYLNDVALPCWMSAANDTVYFYANVSAGANHYSMRYRNQSTTMNCTSAFAIENASRIVPFPEVSRKLLSASRINTVNATPYEDFKASISANREFQIEFNISSAVTSYGPNPPLSSNVYVSTLRSRVEETGANATIRISVW